jgi:hypothetical protein
MTPNLDDWMTEDAIDLLVALVGRIAFDRMDPLDPRNERFLEWLARETRLNQNHSDRLETERRAVEFAERIVQRRRMAEVVESDSRTSRRYRVQRIDNAPVMCSPPDVDEENDKSLVRRATPWWDLAVAAGIGRDLWDEAPSAFVKLPDEMEDGRYVALSVAGDSMTPLLHTGDTILVRLGHEPAPDRLVVARHPAYGYLVKQVGRVNALRIELTSFNANYPPIAIPNDPSLVLGTVVLRWCPHTKQRMTL